MADGEITMHLSKMQKLGDKQLFHETQVEVLVVAG